MLALAVLICWFLLILFLHESMTAMVLCCRLLAASKHGSGTHCSREPRGLHIPGEGDIDSGASDKMPLTAPINS